MAHLTHPPALPWERRREQRPLQAMQSDFKQPSPNPGHPIKIPTLGELVEVARYFRAAMEQRRTIGLRAFFTVTGFDLLLTKEVLDYPQLRSQFGLNLERAGILAGLALYLCLVVNIERENWRGRESYHTVEEYLRKRLGDPQPQRGFHLTESGWDAMRSSWSGLWPALAATGVGLACVIFLSTL
jgi:hypothetical protein